MTTEIGFFGFTIQKPFALSLMSERAVGYGVIHLLCKMLLYMDGSAKSYAHLMAFSYGSKNHTKGPPIKQKDQVKRNVQYKCHSGLS